MSLSFKSAFNYIRRYFSQKVYAAALFIHVQAVEDFFPTAGHPRHVAEALKSISSKDLEKVFPFHRIFKSINVQ